MTMMVVLQVPVHFNRSMRQNEENCSYKYYKKQRAQIFKIYFICFSFMKRPHPPPLKLLNPPAWRSVRWSQRRSGTNPNPKCKGDNSKNCSPFVKIFNQIRKKTLFSLRNWNYKTAFIKIKKKKISIIIFMKTYAMIFCYEIDKKKYVTSLFHKWVCYKTDTFLMDRNFHSVKSVL